MLGMLLAMLLPSCGVSRFVPEGKHLVKKNTIVIEGEKTEISKSELASYITLKTYKNTFQTNFPTRIHYKAQQAPTSGFWKWMDKTFGKEPVYYDLSEADHSARQMMLYLDKVGYFHSKVTHTVEMKGKKAEITYRVQPAQPYFVNKIDRIIEDTLVQRHILRDSTKFGLKEGDIYNAFALDDERETITERLRNAGYYFFSRDNIYYEVDSNFMDHSLKIAMRLKKSDLAYRRYSIGKISIFPDFALTNMNAQPIDSAFLVQELGVRKRVNHLNFYYYNTPNVKPSAFSRAVKVMENRPYSLRSVTNTYRALSAFRLFRNVNIEFDTLDCNNDTLNRLDCRITMQQNDRHSFTLQGEGTNSGGDLGFRGGLAYSNKNIFHGAETFQLSLKGGLELQKLSESQVVESGKSIFNTWELGITASLMFPKSLGPFSAVNLSRDYQPTTTLSAGFSTQTRYYYSRHITDASLSYDWKSNYRMADALSPFYLNGVKITDINPAFQAYLNSETSQRKKAQYTSHLLFGTRYALTYNTQRLNRAASFLYLRADFESSGNLISLFRNTKLVTQNGNGLREILGVPYAQYLRASLDFRQHLKLGDDSWFVMRQFIGLGIPYGNSQDMPFERSFYGGGANGLRGWLYRTVGPGGYVPASDDMEKTGDLQLELNAEYRFPIYNIFNGAFFVDAGNVWTYHPNESMPNSEFNFSTFYRQIALDAGFGLRLDLSFLLLRIDIAYAMRNPYESEGSHWRFGRGNNLRLQAGIGYPF